MFIVQAPNMCLLQIYLIFGIVCNSSKKKGIYKKNLTQFKIWCILRYQQLFHFPTYVLYKTYIYGSFTPGKMSKICHNFLSLELYCNQTVWFFQVFSIVLKSLCPLESKNTFVLILAFFSSIFKKIIFSPKI